MLEQPAPDPYQILAAGYGPIPLPAMRKGPPLVSGHHGPDAVPVTDLDVFGWKAEGLFGNVGVVLPAGVLGVDVDAYKTPEAWQLWQELSADWPATVCLTARSDGKSGIRLFRFEGIDDERFWGSRKGVDIISHRVRYLTAPGSTHPLGMTYRLIDERDGSELLELPPADELPELSIHQAGRLVKQSSGLYAVPSISRQTSMRRPDNERPCAEVLNALARAREHLTDGSGRHPAMASATTALARLEFDGHPGVEATLRQLSDDFVAAMIAEPRPGENEATWRAEFASMVISARGKCGGPDDRTPTPEAQRGCVGIMPVLEREPAEAEVPRLPEAFWSASPAYGHVRQVARHHYLGAESLLLAALVRVSCSLDCEWVLVSEGIAAPSPINLFGALVMPSGGGKSSTMTIAEELVPLRRPLAWAEGAIIADPVNRGTVLPIGFGSPEGMTAALGRPISSKRGAQWHKGRWSLLIQADEIDRVMGMKDYGSGPMPWLRLAWSGTQPLGTILKSDSMHVAGYDYRIGMILGAQPERLAPLLIGKEADAGTPQRFIWATGYLEADASWGTRPAHPGELDWQPVPVGVAGELVPISGHVDSRGDPLTLSGIPIAASVIAELGTAHVAAGKPGGRGNLDSQRGLMQERLATVLGLLKRGPAAPRLTEADWAEAGAFMEYSDQVRDWAGERARGSALAHDTEREQRRRSSLSAVDELEARVSARVIGYLAESDGQTRGVLRHRFASFERETFDRVLPRLIAQGRLTLDGKAVHLTESDQ